LIQAGKKERRGPFALLREKRKKATGFDPIPKKNYYLPGRKRRGEDFLRGIRRGEKGTPGPRRRGKKKIFVDRLLFTGEEKESTEQGEEDSSPRRPGTDSKNYLLKGDFPAGRRKRNNLFRGRWRTVLKRGRGAIMLKG